MQNEQNEWGKVGFLSDLLENHAENNYDENELSFPLIENETKEDRANRILHLMERSNARLSRVLGVLDRISSSHIR